LIYKDVFLKELQKKEFRRQLSCCVVTNNVRSVLVTGGHKLNRWWNVQAIFNMPSHKRC